MKSALPRDPMGRMLTRMLASLAAVAVLVLLAEPIVHTTFAVIGVLAKSAALWLWNATTSFLDASEGSARPMRIGYHLLCCVVGVGCFVACRRTHLATGKPFSKKCAAVVLVLAVMLTTLLLVYRTVLFVPAPWQELVLLNLLLAPILVAAYGAVGALHEARGGRAADFLIGLTVAVWFVEVCVGLIGGLLCLQLDLQLHVPLPWGPSLLAVSVTQLVSFVVSGWMWGTLVPSSTLSSTGRTQAANDTVCA